MLDRLKNFTKKFASTFNNKKYYGFSLGQNHLEPYQIKALFGLLNRESCNPVSLFEETFAKEIGDGKCVSFAAGRMGFFALMQSLGIGSGDEVILLGYTCSVMPNAVLRAGATPVFVDVDHNTFGSSLIEIEKKVSVNTKMIVAQHSFGIPCDLLPIIKFSRSKKIFLLEDCALTFGSQINGMKVGNFGDAALFSIDSFKPLNASAGGLIYTRNNELYKQLKEIQKNSENFSPKMQELIWKKFMFERDYFNPHDYRKAFINVMINRLFSGKINTYLTDDYGKEASSSYPYPAKMPVFLAQLGLFGLELWEIEKKKRQNLLAKFLEISDEVGLTEFLPRSYFDSKLVIIPLRFVYTYNFSEILSKKMSKYIEIDSFWFEKPIASCKNPSDFGYEIGSCPKSEKIGKEIINWPCVFSESDNEDLLNLFKIVHTF